MVAVQIWSVVLLKSECLCSKAQFPESSSFSSLEKCALWPLQGPTRSSCHLALDTVCVCICVSDKWMLSTIHYMCALCLECNTQYFVCMFVWGSITICHFLTDTNQCNSILSFCLHTILILWVYLTHVVSISVQENSAGSVTLQTVEKVCKLQ